MYYILIPLYYLLLNSCRNLENKKEASEGIIIRVQDQGYEIVPVSALIYKGEYTVDKTGRQFEK